MAVRLPCCPLAPILLLLLSPGTSTTSSKSSPCCSATARLPVRPATTRTTGIRCRIPAKTTSAPYPSGAPQLPSIRPGSVARLEASCQADSSRSSSVAGPVADGPGAGCYGSRPGGVGCLKLVTGFRCTWSSQYRAPLGGCVDADLSRYPSSVPRSPAPGHATWHRHVIVRGGAGTRAGSLCGRLLRVLVSGSAKAEGAGLGGWWVLAVPETAGGRDVRRSGALGRR